MNEVITANQGQVTPADNRPRPPSLVMNPFLRPHLARHRLANEISAFLDALFVDPVSHELAAVASTKLPSDVELARLVATLTVDGQATRSEIASITAAMLDAIPTFDATKSPGYLDGLLLALELENQVEKFAPEALAGAAFQLFRSEKFAPTPDLVVSAVRQEERSYRKKSDVIRFVLAGREKLRLAMQNPPVERGPKSAAKDNQRDGRAGSGSVSASPATGDDAA